MAIKPTTAAPLIGLFGGTFDPPHLGHLQLAQHFARQLPLAEIWLIPTGQPWQKPDALTPAPHRLAMTEIAANGLRRMLAEVCGESAPKVVVSRVDIDHDGPTYTVDTLARLRTELGAAPTFAWLMGADQLQQLNTWQRWPQLFERTHLCVAARPGYALDALPDEVHAALEGRLATPDLLQSQASGLVLLDRTLDIDLSSTSLRKRLAGGATDDQALPPGVGAYIAEHRLYSFF